VHFEIELVVALARGGKNIAVEHALEHVYGYAVGLDMTRRDLQGEAKQQGRPWEVGKAFDASAPCSAIVPARAIGHPDRGAVWLDGWRWSGWRWNGGYAAHANQGALASQHWRCSGEGLFG